MKKLFLFFVLFPLLTIAQSINGTIISQKNNLPVESTNVFARSSKVETVTDEEGKFSLKLLPKFKNDEILEFSHIGYVTKKISLHDFTEQNFKVFLEEEIENLSGVTVPANQKLTLKSKLSFNKLSPLKHGVFGFGSCLKDDKIYVIGGDASFETDAWEKVRMERPEFSMEEYLAELKRGSSLLYYKGDFSIYDTKTDTWEVSNLKLNKRAFHNIHFYSNSLYVLGGKRISVNGKFQYLQDQIEVLDLDKQTIKKDNTNPHKAANFASCSYKDNIIVLGGSVKMSESGKKVFSDKVHLYNITSGYWYELANMPTAKETTGIVADDKIYLIGGNNGKPLSEIESFDLLTQKWQTEGELFLGLERPAITAHDNIIYFFEKRKMNVYNLKTKQLKEYEIELPMEYSAMYYSNNKLYLLGGQIDRNYSAIPSANVFSIDISEFETTKPTRIKTLSQEVSTVKTNG